MTPQLDIVELDQDELALVWPLVRSASPHSVLGGWQTFAEGLIDRGGRVLAVAAPNRALHGVATYEVVDRADFGRVLNVDVLVTFELSRRAPARKELMKALRQAADDLGCARTIISAERRPRPRDQDRTHSLVH